MRHRVLIVYSCAWALVGMACGMEEKQEDLPSLLKRITKEDLGMEVHCGDTELQGLEEITTWPAYSKRVTQGFKNRNNTIPYTCGWHSGIDIGYEDKDGNYGPIKAAGIGRIVYIGEAWKLEEDAKSFKNVVSRKGPNGIIIAHGKGVFSTYGHASAAKREYVGRCVKAGAVIGTIGNTGFSFGAHLHFEILTEETMRIHRETKELDWTRPFGNDDCESFIDPSSLEYAR